MDLETLRYRTAWTDEANRRAFAAPADPWKLVDVDPAGVEWCTNDLRLNWGLGRVQGGQWDLPEHRQQLSETATYRTLIQRFAEGYDWEDTATYERAALAFADGKSFRGYDSMDAFRGHRLSFLDDLYERIDSEGYRPNAEGGHENPAAAENAFEDAYAHYLEPLIAIGRDGEVIWVEGYHRLGIAAVLGLDAIPVQVLCRHAGWQRIRDKIAEAGGGLPGELEEYREHPDLAELTG